MNSEDLFDRTVQAALEYCNVKQLHAFDWFEDPYGRIDRLKFDWHSLEGLEVKCLEADFNSTYKDLITVGYTFE